MLTIRFHKKSADQHTLEIVRPDGTREEVMCETRSFRAVQERMRQLMGRWNGTPYGSVMELSWK